MIEQMNKRLMKEAGYARAELPREPRWIRVFWEGVREIPQFFRYLWVTVPLALAARDPAKIDDVEAKLYARINPAAWARYPGYVLPPAPPLRALPTGNSKIGRQNAKAP